MNWKTIVIGGLAFFVTFFIASFLTGFVIHSGILKETYEATSSFWLPALRGETPDMAALMPAWIVNGIVQGLVVAAIYGFVRPAFGGPGWKKGLTFGLLLAAFTASYHLSLSGFLDLPGNIWLWWSIDAVILYALAGTALGLVTEKVAPG